MAEDTLIPQPQENASLWGQESAEAELFNAATSGRLHHAWLISGPRGIGKATLAYRFARWLIAGGGKEAVDENAGQEGLFGDLPETAIAQEGEGLAVSANDPVFLQIAAGAHPDVMVVGKEDVVDEKAKQGISVEAVRKVGHFLSLTSGQSDWRIVIVDDADSMNRNAANALLKLLEEPPAKAMLLLVSHTPGKLLPTIRSRCRSLKLRPLEESAMQRVMAHFMPELGTEDMRFALTLAEGSPGVAMQLASAGAREMYERLLALLQNVPEFSIAECISLTQLVGAKSEPQQWEIFSYLLNHIICSTVQGRMTGEWRKEAVPDENAIKKSLSEKASLDKWVDLWEKVGQGFADVNRVNMERRHSAICMLESFRSMAA